MTKIFFILIIFPLLVFPQKRNKIIIDNESDEPMLIGYCTRGAFNDSSFAWWDSEYEAYKIDSTRLNELNKLNDCDITVIMGTWCSDSRIEVPDFYKILDEISYPSDKVTLICVNRDKKTESNEIDSLEVKLVPTFIFYNKGKEVGRIVEFPDESLEADIANILNANMLN